MFSEVGECDACGQKDQPKVVFGSGNFGATFHICEGCLKEALELMVAKIVVPSKPVPPESRTERSLLWRLLGGK